jgi:hypothetical protein
LVGLLRGCVQRGIVIWANGILRLAQSLGVGAAVGKEVDDGDRPKSPSLSQANAAANSGVVYATVGLAGVEHDDT